MGHHVFSYSCQSLLLSTIVLNDTHIHTYVRTYIAIILCEKTGLMCTKYARSYYCKYLPSYSQSVIA